MSYYKDPAGAKNPAEYYSTLVGEEFEGTHVGEFSRDDDRAVTWAKIMIGNMPRTMEGKLQAIASNFEGAIWKGFHNGIIYVNPSDHHDWEDIMNADTFRIKDFKVHDYQWNPKEPEKYTSQQGYCFILSPVM